MHTKMLMKWITNQRYKQTLVAVAASSLAKSKLAKLIQPGFALAVLFGVSMSNLGVIPLYQLPPRHGRTQVRCWSVRTIWQMFCCPTAKSCSLIPPAQARRFMTPQRAFGQQLPD